MRHAGRYERGIVGAAIERLVAEDDSQFPFKYGNYELSPDLLTRQAALPPELGPFNSRASLGHVPIAGRIATRSIPSGSRSRQGWAATEKTYVELRGRTAWAQRSQIPFHVTSLDWQESDRVLAGIMTAFGAPTGAIDDRRRAASSTA